MPHPTTALVTIRVDVDVSRVEVTGATANGRLGLAAGHPKGYGLDTRDGDTTITAPGRRPKTST